VPEDFDWLVWREENNLRCRIAGLDVEGRIILK
jgi:hypothetical protein